MFKTKIKNGKEGFFNINPEQSIELIMNEKNCFIVFCHILFRKNFKIYNAFNEELFENEILIKFSDMKNKITMPQWKKCLEKLWRWGFIDIKDYKPKFRVSGIKKVEILVDIFDPKTKKFYDDYRNRIYSWQDD